MSLVKLLEEKNKVTCFTTPSHGQKRFLYEPIKDFYKYDISETESQDPQEALHYAQL